MKIQTVAAAALLTWTLAAAETAAPQPVAIDKTAFERAQQLADGPRRRILEAARMKPVAARAADLAPAPAAAPRPSEPERVLATLQSAVAPLALNAASVDSVPAAAPMELAAGAVAMAALPMPAAAGLAAPRLVAKVEPELPARLLRRGTRRTEVLVDLVVDTDGSVHDVAVRSGNSSDVEAAVVAALRQWRYEAQPAARAHSVRLVIDPG